MVAGAEVSNANQGQGDTLCPIALEGDYAMTIKRYGRYWAVYDTAGVLVCICLYKKGAQEVVRRLTSQEPAHA